MTGAEEKKRLSDAAIWLTEEEIAQGLVECEAWIRRTERYCRREVFTINPDGSLGFDADRAVGLLDP